MLPSVRQCWVGMMAMEVISTYRTYTREEIRKKWRMMMPKSVCASVYFIPPSIYPFAPITGSLHSFGILGRSRPKVGLRGR